jgi:hypothetical protein
MQSESGKIKQRLNQTAFEFFVMSCGIYNINIGINYKGHTQHHSVFPPRAFAINNYSVRNFASLNLRGR